MTRYPSKESPSFVIEGFFIKKGFQISKDLADKFDHGMQIIYEWFTYIKDELFSDPEDFTKYSPKYFTSNEEYDCIIKVENNIELQ